MYTLCKNIIIYRYIFKIFIDAHEETLDEIEKVEYEFNHETFTQKKLTSKNKSSHFSSGYRGWGALKNVPVTVFFKNGETEKINFEMLRHIGWEIAYKEK